MRKVYALLATFAAVAGWVQAAYWRERSDWASPADIDRLFGDAVRDCVEEPGPEHIEGFDPMASYGFMSANVVRAVDPPNTSFPWYGAFAWTDFEDDERTGLRVVHSQDGWYSSKHDAYADMATTRTSSHQVDGEPDF